MITVLITTYNDAEYLAYAVISALIQDYNGYEVLVIDDGSTDNTSGLISRISHPLLRYIKLEHVGRSAALNFGLKSAKYDWVMLLDADDMVSPHKLSCLSGYIKQSCQFVVTTWTAVFTKGRILLKIKYPVTHFDLQKHLLVHSFNNSVLLNRNFILENRGYNETLYAAEDYDLWLRIFYKAEFRAVPEYLTFHRWRVNSFSNRDINKTRKQIRSIQQNHFIEKYDNIITEAGMKADVRFRREYFYGESIIPGIKRLKGDHMPVNLLLLFFNLLPVKIRNYITIIDIKGILSYIASFYSEESVDLRSTFKTMGENVNKAVRFYTRGHLQDT